MESILIVEIFKYDYFFIPYNVLGCLFIGICCFVFEIFIIY